MTPETTFVCQCPQCRSRFRAASQQRGRSARCPNCNSAIVIEPTEDQASPEPEGLQLVGVNCRLCGTRMHGREDQVGQPLTCPDCHTQTTLPAAPVVLPAKVPQAMQGEQYELWDQDDQPWGSHLAAEQKALVSVVCQVCDTRQYVTPEQVGSNVACPDCGHVTKILPPKPALQEHQPTDPELEVEPIVVDESFATPTSPPIYSRLVDFEAMSPEEQDKAISRVATNRKARPQMPRRPLLSGWGAFLTAPGVASRCISLSVMLAILSAFAMLVYPMILSGFGAVAGLPLLLGAATLIGLCLASAAACGIAVVTESSDGNDGVNDWPTNNPPDWLGEAFYMTIAVSCAAIPGYLIAWATDADLGAKLLGTIVSGWLLFPVIHLSTLEASSPWSILMPGVLQSLGRWIGTWMLFYLISGLLLVLLGGVLWLLSGYGPMVLVLGILPGMFAGMLYFRLLGRLAWRIRYDGPG